ncbi:hypothetical protein KCU92_g2515, partial [Aureobasidium melanogenum]
MSGEATKLMHHDRIINRPWHNLTFLFYLEYIVCKKSISSTYGHSQLKTGHPVRSAIHKQLNGRLVLRWVTTWESLLL